jgi:hypothetical protein
MSPAVRLGLQPGEVFVHLTDVGDAEMVDVEPFGVRRHRKDGRVHRLALQIQVAAEPRRVRAGAGETTPDALEADRGLRHPQRRGPAHVDEGAEPLE